MKPLHGSMPFFLAASSVAHPVLVGVRRADLGVVALAGVQVVIEAIQARVGEDACLLVVDQSARDADLDREPRLDVAHEFGDFVRSLRRRAATRHHHAVARRAGAGGALRFGKDLGAALQRVLADRGGRVLRLGAVAAVFRAESVLDVVEDVDLDAATEVPLARHRGGVQQRQQRDIGCVEDPERFVARRGFVAQRAFGESGVAVEHGAPPGPAQGPGAGDACQPAETAAV